MFDMDRIRELAKSVTPAEIVSEMEREFGLRIGVYEKEILQGRKREDVAIRQLARIYAIKTEYESRLQPNLFEEAEDG